LERMHQEKPLVGLLLGEDTKNPTPQRFLAQVTTVEVLSAQESSDFTSRKFAMELTFPEQFKQRQAAKIKQLLKVL